MFVNVVEFDDDRELKVTFEATKSQIVQSKKEEGKRIAAIFTLLLSLRSALLRRLFPLLALWRR